MRPPVLVFLELRGRGTRTFPADEPVLVSEGGLEQPQWKMPDQIVVGDYVGIWYGREWPTTPVAMPALVTRPLYGSEKSIHHPDGMTVELAFLLGAYLSEGHTSHSNWTVVITNSVIEVLERAKVAWQGIFGLQARITRQPDRCPGVVVASKRLVEYMELLGCGNGAANKQVPRVIMESAREHVLAFLQGAALDAYTTHKYAAKWGICLESRKAIDQLQDLVTALGIVNAQIPKLNKQNGKTYFELYAAGSAGQELCRLVPFLEPDKAARAAEYLGRNCRPGSCADVVPGIQGRDLYDLLPAGTSGRSGRGTGRQKFTFLCDRRTSHVSRHTAERVRTAGALLPAWLVGILDHKVHFVEVVGTP